MAAHRRRDQLTARREAYLRVASPPQRQRHGVRADGASSVASSFAATTGGGGGYSRPQSAEVALLRRQQSQDLEGMLLDERAQPEASFRDDVGGPTGRAARQVTLPLPPAAVAAHDSSSFRGFSQDDEPGSRRSQSTSVPSPVPFRGMTPAAAAAPSSVASSFSTPAGVRAPSSSSRSVAFQRPTAGGASSFSVGGGRQPAGSSEGSAVAAGGATPAARGVSILERAAYLNASRSSILSNALAAGRQGSRLEATQRRNE